MGMVYDYCVIGGGIVGAATAYKLQRHRPQRKVLLIEKEDRPAAHQTGHNSGVIHSGIYYRPGSYKARNCVEGSNEIVAFAREHGIKHDVCGKVIVATDAAELPHMDRIYGHGVQNGLDGIRYITGDEIKEIEPYCTGIKGLWVPQTGIIDFVGATTKMIDLMLRLNQDSRALFSEEVIGLGTQDGIRVIITDKGTYHSRFVVVCGGLHSDRLARADGSEPGMSIVGFRGDYYELAEHAKHKVRNLIYPVPNPEFPFLGVHFTRMVDGSVECGPNAVFTFKREGYGKTDLNLRDSWEALTYPGTWRLFAKHWRFGLDEYRRAFSKRLFLQRLQRLIPSLEMNDLVPGRAGVRAMALNPDGTMIDDFKIVRNGTALHVLNAPSPAATASLAIGEEIARMASEMEQD
jgi:L-2-hydroxyglutarate oxidase LhgO